LKTAIIVHSLTGNTLSIAEKLKASLELKGDVVDLEKLEPLGGEDKNEVNVSNIRLKRKLHIDEYDNIVLAGPVRGFSMSPVLKAYMAGVEHLDRHKVVLLVTHFFPFPFMGGTSAISQMKSSVEQKGGKIVASGIVDWKGPSRDRKVERLLNQLTQALQ
jgi:hypothetical protein